MFKLIIIQITILRTVIKSGNVQCSSGSILEMPTQLDVL